MLLRAKGATADLLKKNLGDSVLFQKVLFITDRLVIFFINLQPIKHFSDLHFLVIECGAIMTTAKV